MLTGNLVRLRAVEMDDLDRYVAWINDPEVVQYLATQAVHPFRACRRRNGSGRL